MSGIYFDDSETMGKSTRKKLQLEKLKEALTRSFENSVTGRAIFDKSGTKLEDIVSVNDLQLLPVTRKNDIIELEKKRPYGGFLIVDVKDVDRVFITPGPIYEPLHTESIAWFARSFWAAGFRKGDMVANTFNYHLSPGGLLFHEALRQCGATVVPVGVGNSEILIRALFDLKINSFVGTPSYLKSVIDKSEEAGYLWNRDFSLRRAWFTGEMLSPSLRSVFEDQYGIDTYQAYAVSEVGGAIAYECRQKSGFHIMDDYIVEIIDAETQMPCAVGESGEIVVTPMNNTTWGIFRFGTGDISSIATEECPCGRTSLKLNGILGRVGDAVKVRGLFLVGKQLSCVLNGFAEIKQFHVRVERPDQRDEFIICIELKDGFAPCERLLNEISGKIQDECRLKPDKIEVIEAGTLDAGVELIEDTRKWQ
jgi:phenylacetate-CoA ligase